MKKQLPLVSVIMPVYNAGDFLVPAIESILAQTYKNFELIIVDDASTDNSATILSLYKNKYPKKITVISLKKNLNAGGDLCANKAIQKARGTYIARMDADDIALPTRLEKEVAYLESHPSVFLVGSNAAVINKTSTVIGDKLEPLTSSTIYKRYFTFHPLIHPTTMFRREFKGQPFSYRIKYSANNDYYTFFSLLCEGAKFVNLSEKLLQYRIHGSNDTFVHMKQKFINTLKIRVEMVLKKGYRPTVKDVLTTLAQGLVIVILPESVVTQVYFLSKGITKPSFPSFALKPLLIVKQKVSMLG
jgi:glycosyltransferase involved in cell wall biosynthesis